MDRSAFIVSPTAVNKLGDADFGLKAVGTGPFKFVDWVPNDPRPKANPTTGKANRSRPIIWIVPEAAAGTTALRLVKPT